MTVHFHVGKIPITISITKGDGQARELAEKTDALVQLALKVPMEAARARYVLRRWAGGGR